MKSTTAGDAYEIIERLRRFDGIYRWFQVRGLPFRASSGRIVRWYVLLTDVDDLKRAEEALRESERESRLIVDSIPGLIVALAPDGEVEFVNRQGLEFFGQPLEELKHWGTNGAIHPEDLPRLIENFTRAIASGCPFEWEVRGRRFDGVYRWFQSRGFPLRDASGRIVRWYNLLVDIDERKRAEEELRRAYDSFADAQRLSKTGSVITDLVGDDHNWSEESYRIFEFQPGTKVTLQRIQTIIHLDDRPPFEAMIARAMCGVDVTFSFRIVTARAAVKHVRGIAHVIEQIEGRPMFVGAFQDVTESMEAEEALNKARSELAHVARVTTVSALTASIAHEINQPLSGIITNAGTCLRMLAADSRDIDGARETARRTIRDGNRASDVITRLRALFSKKEFALESWTSSSMPSIRRRAAAWVSRIVRQPIDCGAASRPPLGGTERWAGRHILVFHTTGTNTKVSWTVADRLTHPWSGEGCQMEVMGQQPLVSVVDDDESVRESLPDLLRQCGFAAQTFSSAEAFLASEALDETRCLILDIAMPGMSGPDLQQELIRRRHQIPIVFISAHSDESVRPELLARGAAECLFKPFSETALIDALNTALRMR